MQDWFARIVDEAKAIAAAPLLATAALLLSVAVIWGIVHGLYGASLRDKNTRITFLERRVAEFREKLHGASAEEVRQRLDALDLEVRTLRLRLNPRHLTTAQREAILDRSRQLGGTQPAAVRVLHQEGCSDCQGFADELAGALRETGIWTVTSAVGLPERARSGLAMKVVEPLRPSPAAVILQQALRSGGVSFDVIAGGRDEIVELAVVERVP